MCECLLFHVQEGQDVGCMLRNKYEHNIMGDSLIDDDFQIFAKVSELHNGVEHILTRRLPGPDLLNPRLEAQALGYNQELVLPGTFFELAFKLN